MQRIDRSNAVKREKHAEGKKITILFHTQTKHNTINTFIVLHSVTTRLARDRLTKFLKHHASEWVGWQLFDTKEYIFFKDDILTFIMKMHCRIQQYLHKLINTKTCI